ICNTPEQGAILKRGFQLISETTDGFLNFTMRTKQLVLRSGKPRQPSRDIFFITPDQSLVTLPLNSNSNWNVLFLPILNTVVIGYFASKNQSQDQQYFSSVWANQYAFTTFYGTAAPLFRWRITTGPQW